ncbi:MAG: NAD(P)-binding protein [Anaerolineales bacterium]|nr:MAG: NAD(P)-binding protein [Anaerolineales bacterium]
MAKKNVCIVGGGATGVALLWALSQDQTARQEWNVTLIHDQPSVGGHSLTYYVPAPGKPNKKLPIDIGVQFISPMMYPNVHVMLQRPEFQQRVPMNDYNSLKISAAFPRLNGQPMNWGNFPAYQQGPNFTLYDDDMKFDIAAFQDFIEAELFVDWQMKTLQEFFFPNPPIPFLNKTDFINYILSPYMSIINGYGSALLNDTIFLDLFPLFATLPLPQSWGFPTPLGSFSKPGTGWQRFANGAQSWVEAMQAVAQSLTPSTLILNSKVSAVWTDQSTGQVTVQWSQNGSKSILSRTFDKVVLTTDMWTNSKILNNAQNQYYWNNVYYNPKFDYPIGDYRNTDMQPSGPHVTWDLLWGKCYIHTDSTMLSPDLMQQQETLQFNGYYAPGSDNGNYNLIDTFTTYIQKNVLNDPDAEGLYLTMYGYIPDPSKGQKVPDPSKVLFSEPWTHGRWTPSAMDGPKTKLYMAQGLGNISYPGQMNTNVYFAGNNTTVDSEDGALMSALAVANYAFGVNYPLTDKSILESLFAYEMYSIYHNVMFPKQSGETSNAAQAVKSLLVKLPALIRKWTSSSAASIKSAVLVSAPAKKKSPAKKKAAGKKSKKAKAVKKSTKKPIRKPAKKVVSKKSKVTRKKKVTKRKTRKSVRKTVVKTKTSVKKK